MLVMTAVSVISKHNPRAMRGIFGQAKHEFEKAAVADRHTRQIERKQERRFVAAGMLTQCLHRALHHPAVDRRDHVVALRRRDEFTGQHQLAVILAQSHQQFIEGRQIGGPRWSA